MWISETAREMLKKKLPEGFLREYFRLKRYISVYRKTYRFSFKYFDQWEMLRLRSYIRWQLPMMDYYVALMEPSIAEWRALSPIFRELEEAPKLVMDFGCGLGRSSVFLMHMMGWHKTMFLLVDGNQKIWGGKENMVGSQTGLHLAIPDNSFYTDFDLTDRFLRSNSMVHYDLIDLVREQGKLAKIREVDLIYSFFCIGYHYDIRAAFRQYGLDQTVRPGGLLVFGIRKKGDPLWKEPKIPEGCRKLVEVSGGPLQDFLVLRHEG